jgi:DNA-binding transcriptional regulator GbsR (MarR family)
MHEQPRRLPPELEDVANQVGEFIEYWGFKNIHGRIWAHIYLSEKPIDAQELIERLGVSKALISMSISDLMDYNVIQLAGKTTRGTVAYASTPNLVNVIMNVLRKRERRMLSRFTASTRLLKTLPKKSEQDRAFGIDLKRVDALSQFSETAETLLDSMLQFQPAHFDVLAAFTEEGLGAAQAPKTPSKT